MSQGYGQQMGQRDNHQGMPQSQHGMMSQGMPSHDQWGNPQQPPPMYNAPNSQSRPQHMAGMYSVCLSSLYFFDVNIYD